MPMYEYACPECGQETMELRKIDQRHESLLCPSCTAPMRLTLSLPALLPEFHSYYDDGLGKRVESRDHRKRLMQEAGVEEKGSSHLHGTTGTLFSFPGKTVTSVPKSGPYAPKR